MSRAYAYIAVLAIVGSALGAAYLKGRSDGRSVERAIQLERITELNDALDAKEEELAALEAERLEEMRALEEEVEELRRLANEDPDASRPAIGTDSVRRLNSVR